MVCLIHTRVSIQPWVGHDPVDQVIDDGGDVIYATEPIVERRFNWGLRYAQKLWIGDFVRHAVYLPEKVTQRAGALTPVGRIHRYVQSTSGQDGA